MILSLSVSTFPANLEKSKHITHGRIDRSMLSSQVQEIRTDMPSDGKMTFAYAVPKYNFYTESRVLK